MVEFCDKLGFALLELYSADSVAFAMSDMSVGLILSFNMGLIQVGWLSVQFPTGNPVEALPEDPPPLPLEFVVVQFLLSSFEVRLIVAIIGVLRIQSMRCEEESGNEPI